MLRSQTSTLIRAKLVVKTTRREARPVFDLLEVAHPFCKAASFALVTGTPQLPQSTAES